MKRKLLILCLLAAQADSDTDDDPFIIAALLRDKLAVVSQAQGWSTAGNGRAAAQAERAN